MPQLDFLIMTSQTIFLFIFIVGYVYFLKNILPMISFEVKLKELLELSYLRWFDTNQNKLIVMDKVLLSSLKGINSVFEFLNYVIKPKNILFGFSYGYDLISLRSSYRSKYEDRLF